ncbi:MAG: LysE family translocator [Elainellaceae cyanobacterium]
MTETLNPKTALVFLAFIPQFIRVENGHVFAQFLVLGLITAVMNMMSDLAVALFAGPIGQRLRESDRFRRRQRIASGLGLIGLGTYVAVAEQS